MQAGERTNGSTLLPRWELVGQAVSDMAELQRQIRADGGAADGAHSAGTANEEGEG
jgi:hypothetical protein